METLKGAPRATSARYSTSEMSHAQQLAVATTFLNRYDTSDTGAGVHITNITQHSVISLLYYGINRSNVSLSV